MIIKLLNFILGIETAKDPVIDIDLHAFFDKHVDFYRSLSPQDQEEFQKRCLAFLSTTVVSGRHVEVEDADYLLVAASAVIPVWSFPQWHYFNLDEVILLPGTFNNQFQIKQADSLIKGMVATGGPLAGKMILSKPSLHHGFQNTEDKKNVGIHEFAHLIDMADGDCDGFPERMSNFAYAAPWLSLVHDKTIEIEANDSNINDYAATHKREFFAVASEYFFERPKMLKQKHPELYQSLEQFYQQQRADIEKVIKPRRKSPCPCGSGKKYKNCCEPKD